MTRRPPAAAASSGTVLVVDPDHSARATARRLLESEGYRVLDAGDAAGAERIAILYVGPIHLLLVEVNVPAIGEGSLSDRLRRLHPEIRVLLVSDRPRRELVGGLASRTPVVRKPLERIRLAAKIRVVLGGPR